MTTFIIENLGEVLRFSPTNCDSFSEYCIVALENNNHTPGCTLKVSGIASKEYRLEWSKKFIKSGYKQRRRITERAAEAISFFLCNELTDYSIFEEAVEYTGIDYWLSYKEDHKLYNSSNFIQARIEISGTNEESSKRPIRVIIEEKMKQTDATDSMKLPAYISVVEMATPKAFFLKK